MTDEEATDILRTESPGTTVWYDAFDHKYGSPGPDELVYRERLVMDDAKKATALTAEDLRVIADGMEIAADAGIGTYHLPAHDNIKVKWDKEEEQHILRIG